MSRTSEAHEQRRRHWRAIRTTWGLIRFAKRTGLCPVCRTRKAGIWPDGVERITCGRERCFRKWCFPGDKEYGS